MRVSSPFILLSFFLPRPIIREETHILLQDVWSELFVCSYGDQYPVCIIYERNVHFLNESLSSSFRDPKITDPKMLSAADILISTNMKHVMSSLRKL
jgi:hypothetical protein